MNEDGGTAACPTSKNTTNLIANKMRRTFDDTGKKSATYQSGVNVKVAVSTSSVDLQIAQKPALSSCDGKLQSIMRPIHRRRTSTRAIIHVLHVPRLEEYKLR
jgi:hypothetical protein